MDLPSKRRSIFGGITSTLFGRSYASSETNGPSKPEDSSSSPQSSHTRVGMSGSAPISGRVGANASPESPVKRASDAQLSSRKIIDRPARPSSKLSYSVNAADLPSSMTTPKTTNFSALSTSASATKSSRALVRMPGDNPNKFNTFSGSTFSKSTTRPTTEFSGSATTPRSLFRGSSTPRPGLSTFSPRVPHNTMRESFPPSTPGRPPRGSTAEVTGRTLNSTSTTSLFQMRIPSPPRDLTGERLANEAPQDKNRAGSIYADEYLAHYCPPDFDDLQRRQFFCILDLRRLKYAANEIFAKKDWKLNILNFAKEYEKSRSLIMLRYGLYEFKTVRPSEAVTKQWQKDHGIPVSDDDSDSQALTSGQSTLSRPKRKAEDELVPKDTPLTASSSNLNKRRVTEPERRPDTPAPAKNKRKADSEPDENQPSKLQKAAPPSASEKPSATKSIFERIANGTSSDASPSLKPKAAPSPLFGATKPTGASPLFGANKPASANGSVLEQASPAPSSNIFGHLSDASKVSSNEDDESAEQSGDETASDADGEAEESEAQDQSDEPSLNASGGVSTPQFGGSLFTQKPSAGAPFIPSNTSSEAGDSTKGRSLFDRISYGSDGQPVRAFGEVTPQPSSPEKEKPTSPKEQSSTAGKKIWTAGTPIKFAPTSSQPSAIFGSATPKPANSLFAQNTAPSSSAPAITLEPPTPSKDGEITKTADKNAAPAEQPKQTSSPLFGAPPSAPAANSSPLGSGASTPAFGGFGSKPAGAGSIFGQARPTEEKAATTPAPAPTSALFGQNPAATNAASSKPAAAPMFGSRPAPSDTEKATPASTLFGAKPPTSEENTKPAAGPMFGSQPATTGEKTASLGASAGSETPKPAASVFQSSNLFGSTTKNDEPKPASSPLFGTKPAETTAAAAAPAVGFSFGAPATPAAGAATPAKPLFGSAATPSAGIFSGLNASKPVEDKPATPLFGSTPAASGASTPKALFGAAPSTQEEPKQQGSIFANSFGVKTPAATETPFKFGQSQSTAAAPSFGSQQQNNTQSTAPIFGGGSANSSFTFGAGGGQQASFNNPFANGASSVPSSFNFGGNTGNTSSQPASTPFSFGAANAAPSISFGAGSAPGSGASTPTTQPANMFGAGESAGNSFQSNFAFSGSQSQPSGGNIFGAQPPAVGGSIFAGGLAPMGGTSTGTNSPFTFGGASSMATTPATGTPEPGAEQDNQGTKADGDDAPQEQISLIEGGPGEEDESVVHEVRAKALKFAPGEPEAETNGGGFKAPAKEESKNPWKTQGVGPLRLMKHKTTGAVRMLLRAEPRGHVALNKRILPDFNYKADLKYVKLAVTDDTGKGLETWMIQVRTKELATALAEALETHKKTNEKK